MFSRFVSGQVLPLLATIPAGLFLSGCEVSDFLMPNPDARALYTQPYLGLKQLNSVESRMLSQSEVSALRGRLESDEQELAAYSEGLDPSAQAAEIVAPGDTAPVSDEIVSVSSFTTAQLEALTQRRQFADEELGIYRAASEREQAVAAERAAQEEARAETLRRVEQANAQLAERTLIAPREVEPVPQPEQPANIAQLFTGDPAVEMPLAIIYFASRSAELGPREQVVIVGTARQLAGRGLKIRVRGFDSGSLANRSREDRARSQALSLQRATVVRDLMVQSGLNAVDIEVIALGDQQPVFPEVNATGIYGNQRVEISALRQ